MTSKEDKVRKGSNSGEKRGIRQREKRIQQQL